MISRIKRNKQAGQSTVEFALTIVIVIIVLFGAIEMTLMIYTYNVLADAAKEGVRYAIVTAREPEQQIVAVRGVVELPAQILPGLTSRPWSASTRRCPFMTALQ
jgi:Flp pilus assembly protein TadG